MAAKGKKLKRKKCRIVIGATEIMQQGFSDKLIDQPYFGNIGLVSVVLRDSENFAITIAETVIFMIVNTITIVDLLNISLHNTKIKQ